MTIEQLLCPAVLMWEHNFRQQLNESHIEMTDDEIEAEFDKWLVENEDLVNKSVEDNIDHINEVINRNMDKSSSVNESSLLDDEFWKEDNDEEDEKPVEDEPISGEVEGEKIDPEEPEQERSKLTGAVKLTNKKNDKYNIFGVINDFYDEVTELKTFQDRHTAIMRKLDVSDIRNMNALFAFTDLPNLDLSTWNTSSVRHMEGMFYKSTFNNDSICHWDVSSCDDFKNMFLFSDFNQSLKSWTPKWIEKQVTKEDGSTENVAVRADLPIIGSNEDEVKAAAKNFRRSLFKTMREEDEEEVKENKMIHVVDFDTFINEGKFRDFIGKGIEKVKGFFKSIALKFGSLVAFFNEDGDIYPAVSPYTSLNLASSGKIPGVSAFCDVQNEYLEGVSSEASIVPEPGYYGIIDKDSVEYRNYLTFASELNEHYQKYGDTGALQMVNEEDFKRVGFSAASGGVVAPDIDSEDLLEILEDLVENVPAYKKPNGVEKVGRPVFIWGAPGIGKSTIPKAIIRAWNANKGDALHKKALMTVQCGDLTIDGFSLPIPVEKSIGEYLDERPILKDKVKEKSISLDSIEKIKNNMHKVSVEAPKTWLPAYKVDATPDEVKILNDIANGYLEIKEKNGEVEKIETTEGGILLFDEFFRADENIFKILMQLVLNREYSGYKLGNKWGILCCSNRPNDDEEVRTGFEKTGAVVGTRMLAGAYNFIPSFDEWKKWAVTEGGFDDITLEFLMLDKDPSNGEYTNWHTIRPDEYIQRGKTAWPTPRTWSALIGELRLYCENHGYSNITEIPEKKLRRMADGIIGEDMAVRYVSFLKQHASTIAVDAKSVLENPDYTIPASSKCADVVRQIENYVTLRYDKENVPEMSLLMNLFNKLNDTYSGSKDNFVKLMHRNILKHLDINKNKFALKDYIIAVDKRYGLDKADFR